VLRYRGRSPWKADSPQIKPTTDEVLSELTVRYQGSMSLLEPSAGVPWRPPGQGRFPEAPGGVPGQCWDERNERSGAQKQEATQTKRFRRLFGSTGEIGPGFLLSLV